MMEIQSSEQQEKLERLAEALRECQGRLVEMRDGYEGLVKELAEAKRKEGDLIKEVKKKDQIIEKLIMEKQDKMLHPTLSMAEQPPKQVHQCCLDTHQCCKTVIESPQFTP